MEPQKERALTILEKLCREQGLTDFVTFGSVWEGVLLEGNVEERSGLILSSDGKVYSYWLGWDPKRTAPDAGLRQKPSAPRGADFARTALLAQTPPKNRPREAADGVSRREVDLRLTSGVPPESFPPPSVSGGEKIGHKAAGSRVVAEQN